MDRVAAPSPSKGTTHVIFVSGDGLMAVTTMKLSLPREVERSCWAPRMSVHHILGLGEGKKLKIQTRRYRLASGEQFVYREVQRGT